jgi:hypothetical protein
MVPERLCLRSNRDEVIQLISQIRDVVLKEKRRIYLYFDRLQYLEPAATIMLVAEIDRCRSVFPKNKFGTTIMGNYPEDNKVYAQLCEMGFYRLISVVADDRIPHGILPDNRPIFLSVKSMSRVEPHLAAHFVRLVMQGAFEMADSAQRKMVAALKEAMQNSNEHAYMHETEYPVVKRRWWIAGHLDPETREMMVLLFDQGIGIPRHLPVTTFDRIKGALAMSWTPTDGHMIAAATELFRSSTGSAGRGRGFRDMKRFVDACDDGELRVLSNRGAFTYTRDDTRIDDYGDSIGGTLIEWRVRHSSVAEIHGD